MGTIIAYNPHAEPRPAKAGPTTGQLAARAEALIALEGEGRFLASTPTTHRRHRSRIKFAAVQLGRYVQPLGLDWFEARDALLVAAGPDAGGVARMLVEVGLNSAQLPADLAGIADAIDGLSPSTAR